MTTPAPNPQRDPNPTTHPEPKHPIPPPRPTKPRPRVRGVASAAIRAAAARRVDDIFASGWRPSQEQLDKLGLLLRPTTPVPNLKAA